MSLLHQRLTRIERDVLLADEQRRSITRPIIRLFLIRLKTILSADEFNLFVEAWRNTAFNDEAVLAKIGADPEAMRLFGQWLSAYEKS